MAKALRSTPRKFGSKRLRKFGFWFLVLVQLSVVFRLAWRQLSVSETVDEPSWSDALRRLEKLLARATAPLGPTDLRQAFQYFGIPNAKQHRLEWLHEILKLLYAEFDVLPCQHDAALVKEVEVADRVLVALNLRSCEDMMPNFVVQLLRFLSLHAHDQVRISIYESGSTDSTSQWLLFLKELLEIFRVQNRIVTNGPLMHRLENDRILQLAQLRNAAIAPMYEWYPWRASKVLFVNDVFFCPQHMLRLLRHEADVACGMDFVYCVGCMHRQQQQMIMQQYLEQQYKFPKLLAWAIPKYQSLLLKWRRALTVQQMQEMDLALMFYDKWVTLDVTGVHFLNKPPYSRDPSTAEYLAQGLPAYVYSCWNGMAAIDADLFYQNLQFRHQFPEECQSSECFFLCHDFALLGRRRILIDPAVRLAYSFIESLPLYNDTVVLGLKFLPWYADGVLSPDMKVVGPVPEIQECCILGDGTQSNFRRDCRMFDYSNLNCTARSLRLSDNCTTILRE